MILLNQQPPLFLLLAFLKLTLLCDSTSGSLSFLPSFLGGGGGGGSAPPEREKENSDNSKFNNEIEHSPVVKPQKIVYYYHPIYKLAPKPNQSPMPAPSPPSHIINTIPIGSKPIYQIANSITEPSNNNELPVDLQNLALNLGYKNTKDIPTLTEITEMLGMTNGKETIEFIRGLASTDDGMDLIRSFISPELSDYDTDSAETIQTPDYLTIDKARTLASSASPNMQFNKYLDTAQTDLSILRTILQPSTTTPTPPSKNNSGFFQRLASWLFLGSDSNDSIDNETPLPNLVIKNSNIVSQQNPNILPITQYIRYPNGKLYPITAPPIYSNRLPINPNNNLDTVAASESDLNSQPIYNRPKFIEPNNDNPANDLANESSEIIENIILSPQQTVEKKDSDVTENTSSLGLKLVNDSNHTNKTLDSGFESEYKKNLTLDLKYNVNQIAGYESNHMITAVYESNNVNRTAENESNILNQTAEYESSKMDQTKKYELNNGNQTAEYESNNRNKTAQYESNHLNQTAEYESSNINQTALDLSLETNKSIEILDLTTQEGHKEIDLNFSNKQKNESLHSDIEINQKNTKPRTDAVNNLLIQTTESFIEGGKLNITEKNITYTLEKSLEPSLKPLSSDNVVKVQHSTETNQIISTEPNFVALNQTLEIATMKNYRISKEQLFKETIQNATTDTTSLSVAPIEINSFSSSVINSGGSLTSKPQRGSGYEAYATGRIHRADPIAINIPKIIINQNKNSLD